MSALELTLLDGSTTSIEASRVDAVAALPSGVLPRGVAAGSIVVISGRRYAVQGIAAAIEAEVAGAAGGSAASEVIWRWNETDTSQFQVAMDTITPSVAALSVVSTGPGPRLRVAFPTKVSGNGACVVTIVDPDFAPERDELNRYRYTMRFSVAGFSGVGSEWYVVGPAFGCSRGVGAAFYGFAQGTSCSGGSGRAARIAAGVLTLPGVTPGWLSAAADLVGLSGHRVDFVIDVSFRHDGVLVPAWRNRPWAQRKGIGTNGIGIVMDAIDDAYWTAASIGPTAPFAAQTLNTCGLYMLGSTGATANQYWEFDEIAITRHPLSS